MHEVQVNLLFKLVMEKSVAKCTGRLYIVIAVDWDVKFKQNNSDLLSSKKYHGSTHVHALCVYVGYVVV